MDQTRLARDVMTVLFKLILGVLASLFKSRAGLDDAGGFLAAY